MQKIKLLDEDTINKIAAGEVIERPASVVKELVENSIDAGATRILIEVEDGGKILIKVTDDGCGIDREDLSLAFHKHATSKISGAEDLGNISTLGFRGEALASIASVAGSVEVYTKPRSGLTGTYMSIENGKTTKAKEIGCPIGTSIAVRNLFSNVPARRKHLKSASDEMAHIIGLVQELAIINYGISFELFTGRRTIFKSHKSSSWNDALLKILGLEVVKGLIPFEAEIKDCKIVGSVGDPLTIRSSPDWIYLYVNSRSVTSKALLSALREAYRTLIPLGKNPIAVVSLEINPALIDVNVHPAKKEIRLLNENEIAALLTNAVIKALQSRSGVRSIIGQNGQRPTAALPENKDRIITHPGEQRTLPLGQNYDRIGIMLTKTLRQEQPEEGLAGRGIIGGSSIGGIIDRKAELEKPKLNILGQIQKLYIVAESEEGMMLIDQHAAAERIRFEMLKEKYRTRKIAQELVEPVTIELTPKEQVQLESWIEVLSDIGFDISHFGGSTYNIRSVPAIGSKLESPQAVHDVLRDLFSSGKIGPDSTSREEILKLLACRGSIKSGKELTLEEMKELLKKLFACESPRTCPHGRPVAVVLDEEELERLFGRR
ncbi:MAG: DNA mismatch repair endonuclease MutL [Methanotrichaceae archaeon]